MSKKLISLLLAIYMLFCLSACGTKETNSNPTKTPLKSQTDTAEDNDEKTSNEGNIQLSSNTEGTNENNTNKTPTQTNQSIPTSTTNQPTHTHSYSNATCTSPKKCSCGVTAGNALGHQFSSATCTSPQICNRCGATNGNALGHNYVNNSCTGCGMLDPNSSNLSEKIIGEWELTEESKDAFSDDYPGRNLRFSDNGKCYTGHYKNPYFISGNTMTMDSNNWFSEKTYTISIDKNILMLQYKGYKPLYYKKKN